MNAGIYYLGGLDPERDAAIEKVLKRHKCHVDEFGYLFMGQGRRVIDVSGKKPNLVKALAEMPKFAKVDWRD